MTGHASIFAGGGFAEAAPRCGDSREAISNESGLFTDVTRKDRVASNLIASFWWCWFGDRPLPLGFASAVYTAGLASGAFRIAGWDADNKPTIVVGSNLRTRQWILMGREITGVMDWLEDHGVDLRRLLREG